MADKKISALPPASTPLAGSEVLPVVQGGTTDQVSVANLTSGRTVDMLVANAVLNDAATNTISYPVVATHTSSGTTAPGFGVGVNFIQENTTYSSNIQVATIESISTSEADIHNDMVFKTKYNNTLAERARIKNGADFVVTNGNLVVGTAGKGVTTSGATALGLGTNNAVTAVTIDTSNNVGINTPGNPNARFEVFDGAVRFGNASGNGFLFADGTATLVGSLSNHPLHFYTNNTKRAEIDTSGNFSAGVGALATNATNGFLYIPTCPGVPTGTPTTKTGLAPLVVDSTNNKLYVYVGGSWVAMN